MGKQRRVYSKEFKLEAVRMVVEGGLSASQVARDLDVPYNVLIRWKQQAEKSGEQAFPGHGRPADQELARLKRENEVLRMERDILKKAVGIFSEKIHAQQR